MFSRVILWTALAALSAAFGPYWRRRFSTEPGRVLGWANALAAGAMLGVAYPLMHSGVDHGVLAAGAGAVLGTVATYSAHVLLGVGAGDPPPRPALAVVASAVHAAPEGVAIGAAMALGVHFGLFLILTLAVHNVWEGAVLAVRLVPAGRTLPGAGALAVVANIPQVAFAGAAYALATMAVPALPILLGSAFGALVYLCFAELLPDSYQAVGRTSIAVVVSVATGVVALIGGGQ